MNFKVNETNTGGILINFNGRLDIENTATVISDIKKIVSKKIVQSLILDLQSLTYLDDFGALALFEIKTFALEQQKEFSIINIPSHIQDIFDYIKFDSLEKMLAGKKRKKFNIFVNIGESIIDNVINIKFMISFLGSTILAFFYVCAHPSSLRVEDTITQMEKTGVSALPIVALISFLLGLIMAFMSSLQLQQFGANIYVASLVALAMTSELGPIMTAIIVAGRSGSAYAAEIASMQISEEVDALVTMGFDPTHFLVMPRLIASLIVIPILTLFANVFAITGGLIVGLFILDITASSYINQTIETLSLFEVVWGIGKSFIFAVSISWIGCLRGFQARGGASSVGQAATSAVVTSIFMIVVIDSVFAIIRAYWM
ncbi:MAG: MlaE family lipid ABC transporter permease subunit [Desulfobacterales bacterium]|nr:MlaE family lipid ABC transporter permease subunit [Desulfobacterales bacterium]